ncbi:hypothetical protein Tco_1009482 [Tanacetum coccineum]
MSSSIFIFLSLPVGAEFLLEAEIFLLPLAGAKDGSFMVTPFNVSGLNVELDFNIDLIVFGPEIGSTPANFYSGGRGMLQTKDSSAASYSVAEELVIATEESVIASKGSVIFTCD